MVFELWIKFKTWDEIDTFNLCFIVYLARGWEWRVIEEYAIKTEFQVHQLLYYLYAFEFYWFRIGRFID